MLALRKMIAGPGAELQAVEPMPLRPGEVRLAVEAVGICGTDLHIVDWHGGYEAMIPALPVTLGHEIAARVIEGEGLPVGQRVVVRPSVTCDTPCEICGIAREERCWRRAGIGIFRDGGFALTLVSPARNCVSIPAHVSSDHAALAEPLTVSHEAARKAAITPGDAVLVLGPGPIGLGAALFARELGASVVIAGRDDAARLGVARDLGFSALVDVGGRGLDEAFADAGIRDPFQAIIEATGVPSVLREALDRLAPHGRMVVAGIHPREVALDVTRLVRQHQSLIGSYRAPLKAWDRVLGWIEAHPGSIETLISARLPLKSVEAGLDLMRRREAVKIIIEPGA
jgi:threonine dehydrogenase-like Zn-dependent dehydrogenase